MIDSISKFLSADFSLNGGAILLIGGIGLILIIILISYVFTLRRKVDHLSKPKYGFLGKPLYQTALIVIIVLGFSASFLNFYINPRRIDSSVSQGNNLGIDFNFEILERTEENVLARFHFVPTIGSKEWGGDSNRKFNVKILFISGTETFEKIFLDKTKETGITFEQNLTSQDYILKITIISGDQEGEFEKSIEIE